MQTHFESTIANVYIADTGIMIDYLQLPGKYKDIRYVIQYSDITNLMYIASANTYQAFCLHITGNVLLLRRDTGKVLKTEKEHFLYLEQGYQKEVLNDI